MGQRPAPRFHYLLGNLEDYARFDPNTVDASTLHEIDLWALGQLNALVRDVRAFYEAFEFYKVYQRIYQFCSVTLSSLYLDVLKDRLYAEAPDGPDRRAARFVLARLHDHLTRLLAPIIPHSAEELWDFVPESPDKTASVHLAEWPEPTRRGTTPSGTRGGTNGCAFVTSSTSVSKACAPKKSSAAVRRPRSRSPR